MYIQVLYHPCNIDVQLICCQHIDKTVYIHIYDIHDNLQHYTTITNLHILTYIVTIIVFESCYVVGDASAHSFEAVAEGNSFTRIGGASKPQPTVKKQSKKPGPNESCHCGSGKKYKKCHMLQDQKFNQ